jgi:hypothetical protein
MQPSLDNASAPSFCEQPGDGRAQLGDARSILRGGRQNRRKSCPPPGQGSFDGGNAASQVGRLQLIAFC